MKKTYSELLRDPRWQKLRLKALEAAEWKCDHCEGGKETLNVHHRWYKKDAAPWEYEHDELQVLCEKCHKTFHDFKKSIDIVVGLLGPTELPVALGVLKSLVLHHTQDMNLQIYNPLESVGASFICSAMEPSRQDRTREIFEVFARAVATTGVLTSEDLSQFNGAPN